MRIKDIRVIYYIYIYYFNAIDFEESLLEFATFKQK